MKAILGLILPCIIGLSQSLMAEKVPSVEESHKQLLECMQKDMAEMAAKPQSDAQGIHGAGRIIQMVRDMKPGNISSDQLRQLGSYVRPGLFPAATDELLTRFQELAKSELETQKSKVSTEFTTKVRGYLMRAMQTGKPDELAAIQKELSAYGEEISKWENRDLLNALPSRGSVQYPRSILEYLAKFRTALASEEWGSAGSQLASLENTLNNVGPFLSSSETTELMSKLRADAGIVPPQEFEAVYQKKLSELLDDANQDRIEDIMLDIRKYASLSVSGSSRSSFASRWERMGSFASSLMQAIQRIRDGAAPQLSVESWSRSDSGYPILMPKARLLEALGKYSVKVKEEDGELREERLFYTAAELRDAASSLLQELLDDSNQTRLENLQERIRIMQRYCSYNSEQNGLSQRFQQISSFAQFLTQAVRRIQNGGAPRMNLDDWFRSNSEYGALMDKEKLSGLLRKYKVRVSGKDGKVTEYPLYQELNDILDRIHSPADIEKELGMLTMMSQSASYESGQGSLPTLVSSLSNLAEIHSNLKKDVPFTLPGPQTSPLMDFGNRSAAADTPAGNPAADKIQILRNEVERTVVERMVSGLKIDAAGDREAVMRGVIRKLTEEKNYAGVLAVGRVTSYFAPKRPLVPAHELGALQNYLDGVRQQEELQEPRMATMHLQRAAAARSSIIPVGELRDRLFRLRRENPQAYEKGTDDSLGADRSVSSLPMVAPTPPLIVPGR